MKIRTALMTAVITGLFLGVMPAFAASDFEKGTDLYAKGQFHAASDAFVDAICAQPNYYPAHYALANSYMKLGKMGEAQTEYEMCLEMHPDKSTKSRCQVALKYLTGTRTGSAAVTGGAESLSNSLAVEGERRAAAAATAAEQKRAAIELSAAKAAERYKDNAKAQVEAMKANAPWWTLDRAQGRMVPVIPLGVEDAMNERADKQAEYALNAAKTKAAAIKPDMGAAESTEGLRTQIYPSNTSSIRLSPVGTNLYVRNYEANQVAGKSSSGVK